MLRKTNEALKPVMEEIKAKKQEAEMIRRSRMAVRMQEEKLTEIDAELAVLEKKANEIRKANMKEFESILTKQQKKKSMHHLLEIALKRLPNLKKNYKKLK